MSAIGRKVLSLALIFNSIVSSISAANMLASFYTNRYGWQPYSPYLVDGSLFWFIILTAVLNIVPAKAIGKANVKRILFHHYIYGFLASSISLLLIAVFAPAYFLVLLIPWLGFQTGGLQTLPIYAGSFFVYGGLTLMIDDIRDISLGMGRTLDKLKAKIQRSRRPLQTVHLCSSLISLYVMMCGVLWYLENSIMIRSWPLWDMSHVVFMSSLLVTSLWGVGAVRGRLWFMKIFTDFSKTEFPVRKG